MRNLKHALGAAVAATSLLFATHGAWAATPQVDDTPIANPNLPDPYQGLEVFDEKVMPGIACDAQQGVHVQDLNRVAHPTSGSYLENKLYPREEGGHARSVKCPIVRDNTTAIDGTWSAAISVYNPPHAGLICILDSYDAFGVWVDSASRFTALEGDQTLDLDPGLAGDVGVSTNNGFYLIRCTLPPQGRIYSYRWAERTRTDRNN